MTYEAGGYGAIEFPVPAPATGETAGDPVLDVLAAYCKAVVNARLGAVWAAVAPLSLPDVAVPVQATFTSDPEMRSFSDRTLPALYVWRSSIGKPTQLGDDFRVRESEISVAWVLPSTAQDRQTLRTPLIDAFSAAIDMAITEQRDPSWISDGDTDENAEFAGSYLGHFFEFVSLQCGKTTEKSLLIPLVDGRPLGPYPRLTITIEIRELMHRDMTAYTDLEGMTATIASPDDDTQDAPLVFATIEEPAAEEAVTTQLVYYGVSVPPLAYDDDFITDLAPLTTQNGDCDLDFNAPTASGKKAYVAIRTSNGDMLLGVNGWFNGFVLAGTVSITNIDGTHDYDLWETVYANLGDFRTNVRHA